MQKRWPLFTFLQILLMLGLVEDTRISASTFNFLHYVTSWSMEKSVTVYSREHEHENNVLGLLGKYSLPGGLPVIVLGTPGVPGPHFENGCRTLYGCKMEML